MNPEFFDVLNGKMGASIFENEFLGIEKKLVFDITLPLKPFDFNGGLVETEYQLDFINLPIKGIADLEGKEFVFPVNPDDGYIDGSMYLDNVHNMAFCSRIKFGKICGNSIEAELDIEVDFTIEGPENLGVQKGKLTSQIAFDPEKIKIILMEAESLGNGEK